MLTWSDGKAWVPVKQRPKHANSWWHLYQGREGTCAPSSVATLIYNMGYSLSAYIPFLARNVLMSEVRRASKWAIWNKDSEGKKLRTRKEWNGKYPGMTDPQIIFLLEAYGLNIETFVSTAEGDGEDKLIATVNNMPTERAAILTHDDHAMCIVRRTYGAMIFDPAQQSDAGGLTWVPHSKQLVSKVEGTGVCITKNDYNKHYPVESIIVVQDAGLIGATSRSAWRAAWTEHQYLTWWMHWKKK